MESGRVALAGLLGRCPAMERLKREVVQFGPSELRVHLFGETGTGKEMVAKALHEASPRARRPLVPVNVAGSATGVTLTQSSLGGGTSHGVQSESEDVSV